MRASVISRAGPLGALTLCGLACSLFHDRGETPLVRRWRERAQIACGSSGETVPERPIEELPPDLDAEGSYEIDGSGRLVLRDLWLGAPRTSVSALRHCGHVFE